MEAASLARGNEISHRSPAAWLVLLPLGHPRLLVRCFRAADPGVPIMLTHAADALAAAPTAPQQVTFVSDACIRHDRAQAG
ncbi:hypothetical protein U9M48_018421 [Paspalum notatum var. saurae]|uniref:Uncharacterized protein n=1 Tax=Paspalum notatum var. saurae TaxID=547442 RepID=A0AAQ3TA64_PASNO